MTYKALKIELLEVVGVDHSLRAMRLPFKIKDWRPSFQADLKLAAGLIMRGDNHAKAIRGIEAYLLFKMQAGWMMQLDQQIVGVQTLSTSSTMHNELRGLRGNKLAEVKQDGLADHVYTRIAKFSYQALRNMYLSRLQHHHPDWKILCDFVEDMPYFKHLIYPEVQT
ncbi:MAG: hypothetical protein GY710_02025 [Desulfobacteraceae bacterium]|nr:hypothetical protein [Desulfobacteraceae bacterium]